MIVFDKFIIIVIILKLKFDRKMIIKIIESDKKMKVNNRLIKNDPFKTENDRKR